MNAFVSAQSLASATNGNIQAMQSFAEIVLGASERLFALNIDTARSLCNNVTQISAGEPQAQFAERVNAQTRSIEQASDYFRQLSALCLETQGELAAFGSERAGEYSRAFCELCEKLASNAPQGSGDFIEVMKNAMSQTTAAYENFVKTTRDVAESNIAAATTALQPMLPKAAPAPKASRKAAA